MQFSTKEIFDRLYERARWVLGGVELPKKEISLHNQTVGIYFQKRKDYFTFAGKILPKSFFNGLYKQNVRKYYQKGNSLDSS